ncbi:3-carboxy-cis,cis-muconate cycloisomerase [Sneathiella aquimaris]|uniref:3-carboxy-cis,cis-muconate cycloisomerase n=1 Tax=Sneathiella aquimaris TaxID=2599305 RepID=UPI001469D2EB|nr:3-carboxy-cis,cis-muconate cycloisomerase [Sneathiella aquimaris]
MMISIFEHPILGKLLGNSEMALLFSAEEDVACMLAFEGALARVQGRAGIIPDSAVSVIMEGLSSFQPNWKDLAEQTEIDGVVVPGLIRQIRQNLSKEIQAYLHYGATSQDVIDTSLALRLKRATALLRRQMEEVLAELERLKIQFGQNGLIARTRMQQAIPTSAAEKINRWQQPLTKLTQSADAMSQDVAVLQFGGAVGTLDKLGDKGTAIGRALAEELDLSFETACRHTDRSSLISYSNWLSQITTAVGKVGQDIVLMNQNEVEEIQLKGAGGSSAMPHKKNPVLAEILITLARFNATQVGGMHVSAVHENERSGASWTLEWLILPQMVMATAVSLKQSIKLLKNVDHMGSKNLTGEET